MTTLSRSRCHKHNFDRFIPNRSATKFEFGIDKGWKSTFDDSISPGKAEYLRRLRHVFNIEDQRILAFHNKPRPPVRLFDDSIDLYLPKPLPRRHIPKTADGKFDLPYLSDDHCVNLLDWGSSDVLAIGLENTVYLWNDKTKTASELLTLDDDAGLVASVSWAPDGSRIAVGLDNSHVQLWDSTANKLLTTFKEGHQERVGSLAWNGHILTSGSEDSSIINRDMRVKDHPVDRYQGHRGQICGLKWSQSGRQLASGGDDKLVFIWDQSLASRGSTQWLHRLKDHRAAVRALAWCPFKSNMLATGGGEADGCIKFWNTHTGACLKSYDTGSQVCSLQWSKNDRELLSSHGSSENELSLWEYPSMVRKAGLSGHESPVLFTAQSPDGCTVASAGGELLQFWKVFGAQKVAAEPFSHFSHASGRNM